MKRWRVVLCGVLVAAASTVFVSPAAIAGVSPMTWAAPVRIDHQPPFAGNGIAGVSCPSTGLCVAGDGAGNVVTSTNPTGGAGSGAIHLPLVENGGSDPWNTGEGIMNTGSASTTVTVNYYNSATGAAIGASQSQLLAPQAFLGVYQPTGGLSSGTRATAVVTASSGGQVAVICNESSSTTFMSYDGQ